MVTVIECAAFGPIEDLQVVEREPAPLAPGQVRLEVSAAGVNFVDGLLVEGRYQIKPPLPFVPGGEVVGRVSELGEGVTGLAIGDRMFASIGFGGFASEVVVSPRQLVAIPDSLTDGQAATFMQSYMTGWYALDRACPSGGRRHDARVGGGQRCGSGRGRHRRCARVAGDRCRLDSREAGAGGVARGRGDHRQLDPRRRGDQGRRQGVRGDVRGPRRPRRGRSDLRPGGWRGRRGGVEGVG